MKLSGSQVDLNSFYNLYIVDDYISLNETLEFPAESSLGTRICVNVTIVNDVRVESEEDFSISLSSIDPVIIIDPDSEVLNVTILSEDRKFTNMII